MYCELQHNFIYEKIYFAQLFQSNESFSTTYATYRPIRRITSLLKHKTYLFRSLLYVNERPLLDVLFLFLSITLIIFVDQTE